MIVQVQAPSENDAESTVEELSGELHACMSKGPLRRGETNHVTRNLSQRRSAMGNTAQKSNILQTQAKAERTLMPSEIRAECLLEGIHERYVL